MQRSCKALKVTAGESAGEFAEPFDKCHSANSGTAFRRAVFLAWRINSTNPGELFAGQHVEHTIAAEAAAKGDDAGGVFVHRSGPHGAGRAGLRAQDFHRTAGIAPTQGGHRCLCPAGLNQPRQARTEVLNAKVTAPKTAASGRSQPRLAITETR
ncbi:MAG TPA: hypothetical protein VMP68_24790 [Candidatus Eisenbacteria bacterium]|nr:hypothetical protein [Candidatus Eisenbacteria bacterium]